MNSDHTVTPGQVAYEGYCISLGLTMGFRHFPEDERTAWEAAARAVLGMEPHFDKDELLHSVQRLQAWVDAYGHKSTKVFRDDVRTLVNVARKAVYGLEPMPPAPEQPAAVKESEVQS